MSVENLSPPDADTAVAGDGAVVERAWVADSRFVSSDSTYAVICRLRSRHGCSIRFGRGRNWLNCTVAGCTTLRASATRCWPANSCLVSTY